MNPLRMTGIVVGIGAGLGAVVWFSGLAAPGEASDGLWKYPDLGQSAYVGSMLSHVDTAQFQCEVRSNRETYHPGDVPDLSVRIFNHSRESVFLPGNLDNSEARVRLPHVYFELEGPFDEEPQRTYSWCGWVNPLTKKDLMDLPAGGSIDPYESSFGGSSSLIDKAVLKNPGEYTATFRYWNGEAKVEAWATTTGPPDDETWPLLPRVPLLDLACSVTFTVSASSPADSP